MTDRPSDRAKLAEKYLAAIIQNAEDAIIAKNLDGIVTSWNPAAERIFSYTAQEIATSGRRRNSSKTFSTFRA